MKATVKFYHEKLLLENGVKKKEHVFFGANYISNLRYRNLITHAKFYLVLGKEKNDKKRKFLTKNQSEIVKTLIYFQENTSNVKVDLTGIHR